MKRLLLLLSVLMLSGCDIIFDSPKGDVKPFFVYCKYIENDVVYVNDGQGQQPVVAMITIVHGGRKDGCWYTINVIDGHIYPKNVTIKEARILFKSMAHGERR